MAEPITLDRLSKLFNPPAQPSTLPTFDEFQITAEPGAGATILPTRKEYLHTLERQEVGPGVSRSFADPTTPIQKAWMGVYDTPVAGLSETELRRHRLALEMAGMLFDPGTGQPQRPLSFAEIQERGRGLEGFPVEKGFFSGVKTGAEALIGFGATAFTGRGFRGDPIKFQFQSTREREDDIIWVLSGMDPGDVREIAARTFEHVPGETVNDPVQLREEQEQREAQRLLQRAVVIAKQPGSTKEAIGQMLGGIVTMGVGEEPLTLEAIGEMHPALQAALAVPAVGTVTGPLALGRGWFGPTTRFATTQVTEGLSKQVQAMTPLYAPELQRATFRFMNFIGDADPVMAGRVISPTTPLPSTNIFGFAPLQPGLTRGENLMNLVRRTIGKPFGIPLDEELGTPVTRERLRVASRIESVANGISQKYHARLNDTFTFNKKNQIEALRGIDKTLPTAPTLQDVAARLPTFRTHLSDEQLRALRELEEDLQPFSRMLDEAGVERGFRPDIMDGGFYVPRGRAIMETLDDPVLVPRKRPRTGAGRGPERPIEFDSAAAGIDDGFEYAAIGEVLDDYVTYAGQRARDLHASNYLNALRDADGRLIGVTPAMRVDPELRSLVQKLRRQVRGRNKTLIAQNARGNAMTQEARRLGRKEELAGERVEATAERVAERTRQFADEDLTFARRELQIAIQDAQGLAQKHGENIEKLRAGRVALNKGERQLEKDIEALYDAILRGKKSIADELAARRDNPRAFAGGLKRTVGAHMKDANRLTRHVDRLSTRVERMSGRVDDLIERGQLLRDMRTNARAALVESRQTERALMHKKLGLAVVNRELRILKKEHDRAVRSAGQSGSRLLNARRRTLETERAIVNYQEELDEISGKWDRMLAKSRRTPPGFARVDIPGLESRSFPAELAASINKVLVEEGRPRGSLSKLVRSVQATNRLVQGANTTLDNSAVGIQGLVGMADDQRAWSSALRTNFQAWGNHGDRVLGRFLTQFDRTARDAGRLTSTDWAGLDLRIGGAQIGELQIQTRGLTAALERVPGIRQANRAFGFFGDALRLEWADDMLQNELRMGRTLEQLRRNGDLERIAEIANNMTGYSKNRAGGDLGELVLFAPRFLQSRLTTVTRAAMGLRPGASLDQRIARRSMLKMIGGAVTLTHLINWMQGHETDMRPWVKGNPNSNFMRVRFGKRDFSLLGTWDSLAKSLMLTVMGRPQDVLRTLSSPILRMGWDLTSGETAIGERTKGEAEGLAGLWSEKTGYYALKALSPFAMQEVPETVGAAARGEFLTAGVTLAGEIFGMKSGPLGFTDQKEIVRRELFPEVAEGELNAAQRRRINDDPRVQEQITRLEERRGPVDIDQLMATRFDDVERVKADGEAALRHNIDMGMDGPDLRKKIGEFKQARFQRTDALLSHPRLQEELEEKAADRPIGDVLATAFWTADAPEDPVTGDVDFAARDAEREAILVQADQMGVERWYVTGVGAPLDPVTGEPQSYRGKRYDDPVVREMVERFEADHELMRPYLQVKRDLAERRGLLDVYEEWRASNDPNFLKTHPVFKAVMDIADSRKENIRRNDIELERKLWKWGYIDAALNPLLEGEIMLLRRRQGGQITQRLAIEPEPEAAGVR